jgi:hypothetical protein
VSHLNSLLALEELKEEHTVDSSLSFLMKTRYESHSNASPEGDRIPRAVQVKGSITVSF